MIISILNCDKKYGIGKRNGLLFSLPLDMKFFRETTQGHTVCMGENTLLSFPGSKPLKNRTNIVLSQDQTHNYEGVINVHSFEDFLRAMKERETSDTVFVIGGASIYRQFIDDSKRMILTEIDDTDKEASVFFPNFKKDEWDRELICNHEENGIKYSHVKYLRK